MPGSSCVRCWTWPCTNTTNNSMSKSAHCGKERSVYQCQRQTNTLIKQMTAPHQAREPMSTVELPHVQYTHDFIVHITFMAYHVT